MDSTSKAKKFRRRFGFNVEQNTEDVRFAGLTAVLYVVLVALEVNDAQRIAEVFGDELRTTPITQPLSPAFLADIVRKAREES